jgi:hypothetical protein
MTEPRADVIVEIVSLAIRYRCTAEELYAALDFLWPQTRRGPPTSEIYERLLWGMYTLVVIYGRDRYTSAKQLLNLAGRPVDQRENQARALVRRFDGAFEEGGLNEAQKSYVGYGPQLRVTMFYNFWKRSRLPLPEDIKSASDKDTELHALALAHRDAITAGLAAIEEYYVALDKSIAASSFESGRR